MEKLGGFRAKPLRLFDVETEMRRNGDDNYLLAVVVKPKFICFLAYFSAF